MSDELFVAAENEWVKRKAKRVAAIEGLINVWPEADEVLKHIYQSKLEKLQRDHASTLSMLYSLLGILDMIGRDHVAELAIADSDARGEELGDFIGNHCLEVIEAAQKHLARQGLGADASRQSGR